MPDVLSTSTVSYDLLSKQQKIRSTYKLQNMEITRNEKFISAYLTLNCSWIINITEFANQKADLLTSQLNLCSNVTYPRVPETKPPSVDALMYIIVVLMFYTFSIVVLMVKYIHREKQEVQLFEYYREFVARDKVKLTLYQNRAVLEKMLSETNQKLSIINKNSPYLKDVAKDSYTKKETCV
ncbi:hypothetical protein CHS0354_011655 [Potamilus streckersoni]|uniref:Uncharacterized protein n=1 Tax=Potamilus streckersoni TaxID=2493646 RepID=A0AAE0TLA5_9BIVA|nr:hypothetical protein CHS0354_011655 [Potamilus streckersoni]